jgi:hypothetical protein
MGSRPVDLSRQHGVTARQATEDDKIVIKMNDSNKLHCLLRLNEYTPEVYTRFVMSQPKVKNGRWGMQSQVRFELMEHDGDVVVLLKKGLSVNESTLALWSVAKVLMEAAKAAIKEKKRLEKLALKKKGLFSYIFEFVVPLVARKVARVVTAIFNAPFTIMNIIIRLLTRRP